MTNSREDVVTPPEGHQRMANISLEDLGRIMMVAPEELNPADVAEIIVNIVLNYGMAKELGTIFTLTLMALDEDTGIQKAINLDDLNLTQGGN